MLNKSMVSLKNSQLLIRVAEQSKKTSRLWHNDTSKNWGAASHQSQSLRLPEMVNNNPTEIRLRLIEETSKLRFQHKDRMAVLEQKLYHLFSNRDKEMQAQTTTSR